MHPYFNRFLSTIFSLLVALAWAGYFPAAHAGEAAQPFQALYHGYRDGNHVATAHFSLQHQSGHWRWYMQTKPIGFYRWLTSKQPFEETRMTESAEGLLLEQLHQGDHPDLSPEQSSWFDHEQGIIHFSDSEKNRQEQLDLHAPVYSNHSIHLLYADMKNAGEQKRTVRFFKKGNLVDATLELQRGVKISHGSQSFSSDRISHKLAGSNKELVYYYTGHDLAPLCIEQYKNGKLNNMMWRVSLD